MKKLLSIWFLEPWTIYSIHFYTLVSLDVNVDVLYVYIGNKKTHCYYNSSFQKKIKTQNSSQKGFNNLLHSPNLYHHIPIFRFLFGPLLLLTLVFFFHPLPFPSLSISPKWSPLTCPTLPCLLPSTSSFQVFLPRTLLRGFAKLKKFKKKLDRAHPTHPPLIQTFFWIPITDMDITLKS